MKRRILSLLMAAVMVFSLLPMDAFAENSSTESPTAVDLTTTELEATDSFGSLVANTIAAASSEDDQDTDSSYIGALYVNGTVATVSYNIDVDSDLVVAIYDNDGNQMLGSGTVRVSADEDTAEVAIEINTMPKYFLAAAYLLEPETHIPLGTQYTAKQYTEQFLSIQAKTTADFDPNSVLNLDDDTTTNFAVFKDSTLVLKEQSSNVSVTDNGNDTYTVRNADAAMLALKPGDSFSYTWRNGDVLVIKIQSISVEGSTVTFVADTGAELEDLFRFVKIETGSGEAEVEVDQTAMEPGVMVEVGVDLPYYELDDEGYLLMDEEDGGDFTTSSLPSDAASVAAADAHYSMDMMNFSFSVQGKKEIGAVSFSAKLTVKMGVSMDVYLEDDWTYLSIKTEEQAYVEGSVTGTLFDYTLYFGDGIKARLCPGLSLTVTPGFEMSAEASVTLKFVLLKLTQSVNYDSHRAGTGWDGFKSKAKTLIPKVTVSGEIKVGFFLEGAFKVLSVGTEEVAKANLKLGAGIKISAEMELAGDVFHADDDDPDEIHLCAQTTDNIWGTVGGALKGAGCIDGTIHGYVELTASASFLKHSAGKLTLAGKDYELGKFYYSLARGEWGLGTCPYWSYKLKLTVIDAEKNAVPNAVIYITDENGGLAVDESIITDSAGKANTYLTNGDYRVKFLAGGAAATRKITIKGSSLEYTFTVFESQNILSGHLENSNIEWQYYANDRTLVLTGSGEMPAFSQSSLPPWSDYTKYITSVYLSEGITNLSAYSFFDCEKLETIALPNTVNRIASHALQCCGSLETITIPYSVKVIDEYAFFDLKSLKKVVYTGGTGDWDEVRISNTYDTTYGLNSNYSLFAAELICNVHVLKSGSCGVNVYWSLSTNYELTISGVGAMNNYNAATDTPWAKYRKDIMAVDVLSGVTSIGNHAFDSCSGLGFVTMAGSVRTIGDYAFCNCTSLLDIVIPEGVEVLGAYSFAYCSNLVNVELPLSLTKIGENAFLGCDSLKELTYAGLEEDWTEIEGINNSLTAMQKDKLVFGGGAVAMQGECGPNLYYELTENGHLVITGYGEMTSAPWRAAEVSILYIRFRPGINEAGDKVYLSSICNYAFADTEIKTLKIPDSVISIGWSALTECNKLTDLTLPSLPHYSYPSSSIKYYPYSDFGYLFGEARVRNMSNDHGDGQDTSKHPQSLRMVTLTQETSISSYAFLGWSQIETVQLPETVTSICYGAFYGCTSLKSVSIPNYVDYISDYAFYNCSSLRSIKFPVNLTRIDSYAFYGCTNLIGNMTIPVGVTYIGGSAFYNCIGITSFDLPTGLKYIGEDAFYNCSGLTSLTIPDTVTAIGKNALFGCNRLRELTLPIFPQEEVKEGRNTIYVSWFGRLFGGGTYKSPNISNYPSSLKQVTITQEVEISDYAFYGWSNLQTLKLTTVTGTSIGAYAFYGCENLVMSLKISSGIIDIGDYAFYNCCKIVSIELPDGLQTVGAYAFYNCAEITTLRFPDSVNKYGLRALYGCYNLKQLTLPEVPRMPWTGDYYSGSVWLGWLFGGDEGPAKSFLNPNTDNYPATLKKVTVTQQTEIPNYAFYNWSNIETISISDSVTEIGAQAFCGCDRLQNFSIPSKLTSIGDHAFYNCSGLTGMFILPAGLTSIGESAFNGCEGLTGELRIPAGVTSIGERAFAYCRGITALYLPDALKTIGKDALLYCDKLEELTLPDLPQDSDGNLWLGYLFGGTSWDGTISFPTTTYYPSSLKKVSLTLETQISAYAFYNWSSLQTLELPSTITQIGNSAFDGCRGLKEIIFNGTSEQWNAIKIGTANIPLKLATIYCLDMEVSSMEADDTENDEIEVEVVDLPEEVEDPRDEEISESQEEEAVSPPEEGSEGELEELISERDPVTSENERGNQTDEQTTVPVAEGGDSTVSTPVAEEEPELKTLPAEPGDIAESDGFGLLEDGQDAAAAEEFSELEQYEATEWMTGVMDSEPAVEDSDWLVADSVARFSGDWSAVGAMQHVSLVGLAPGEEYVILSVSSEQESVLLQPDNLLYIAQTTADDNGAIDFDFVPRVSTANPVLVAFGTPFRNLVNGEMRITINEATDTVTVTVLFDNEVLKENEDYLLRTEIDGQGNEVFVVTGIHAYTGSLRAVGRHWHEAVLVDEKDATCTEDGYTGNEVCKFCGEVIKTGETIPATGHTPGESVRENITDATYTAAGSYDEVIYCKVCGVEISRESYEIPKLDSMNLTIAYELNGGENSSENPTEYTNLTPFTLQEPTRYGYIFLGWYDNAELEGDPVTVVADGKPAIVYAKWEVIVRSVQYELNGGTNSVENPAEYTAANPIILKNPFRDGYLFGGWYDNSAFSGDPITVVSDGIPAIVYAKWLEVPTELTLDRNYVLLSSAANTVTLHTNLQDASLIDILVWSTESAGSNDIKVENGVVTIPDDGKPGTYYVVVTLPGAGEELSARCRVDVLDEAQQADTEFKASLLETKYTAEIRSTNYTSIPVILSLVQNELSIQSDTVSSPALDNTGVFISSAAFVGSEKPAQDIRSAFTLRVRDDRILEVLPTIDVTSDAAVKVVKGSYKSAITLTLSNGQIITTSEITLTVKKSVPKLKAANIKLNRFIDGASAPVAVTGGTVQTFTGNQDLGFATIDDDLIITVNNSVGKNSSGKFTLTCTLSDWAVPATLTIPVSTVYTAPKITLKPASLTLNRNLADRASTAVTVKPLAGMTHTITVGSISGLDATYNEMTGMITVKPGTAAAGTYKVPVYADGKQITLLTVKVLAPTAALTLTAKASGAIDTAVTNSPVTLTLTGKNFNAEAADYQVTILQSSKKYGVDNKDVTQELFNPIQYNGNTICVMGKSGLKDYVKDYTYTATVKSDMADAKPVKITVKTSTKTPVPAVTLKATGSIDVLRPSTSVVLTPTYKNFYLHSIDEATVTVPVGFTYEFVNETIVVTMTENAKINTKVAQMVKVAFPNNEPSTSVKLPVKMGAAKVTQSTKTITLSRNDKYDRGRLILTLSDPELSIDHINLIDKKGYFQKFDVSEGVVEIGFKDATLPAAIMKAKSSPVQLEVFLKGNGDGVKNATVSVTVNLR